MIRDETPNDYETIRSVNCAAFGGDAEARLVDALRHAGLVVASLVYEVEQTVVGHALFTKLDATGLRVAALAPVAVAPPCQHRGIGSSLIRSGIERCRDAGCDAIVVLGHPTYYPRFGFSAALGRRVRSPYAEHGDAWMALELRPGALAHITGLHYPAPWSEVS